MDSQRVEVFHVTNSNAIILAITNDLIFDFFPSAKGFVNHNLGTSDESFFS